MTEKIKFLNPIRSQRMLEEMITATQMGDPRVKAMIDKTMKSEEISKQLQGVRTVAPGSDITIRKIERDLGSQYVLDEQGNNVLYSEWEFKRKFIDYKQSSWPEEAIPDFKSTGPKAEKIATYRFPVA
jgi:hypothetical protein